MIKPRQAICIKPYKNQGINFEAGMFEIVTLERESQNANDSELIWVKNKKGWVWYFIKNRNAKIFFTTAPKLEFFDDYFKELK